MNARVSIDESKARNYVMAAATVMSSDHQATQRIIRGLLLPGQDRIHMKHEHDRRRRKILSTLAASGITATIYDSGLSGPRQVRRAHCLEAIVLDLNRDHRNHLILEQDDTLLRADRECLIECVRATGATGLTYEHQRATQELLLVIPDAIARAWTKGGDWRRRLEDIVVGVKKV